MTNVHEIRQDADFELPKPDARVPIEFSYTNGHRRWANAHFTYFQHKSKRFVSSSIKSIACCNAADLDIFDRQLNHLHTLKFGDGQWIIAERQHLPSLSSDNNECHHQHRQCNAFGELSGSKRPREDDNELPINERHTQLRKRLRDLPSSFTSCYRQHEDEKKTGPKAVKAEGESIKKSLIGLQGLPTTSTEQQETIQKAIDQVRGTVSISHFVQNVLKGVEMLWKSSKSHEQIPFVRLAEYCNNRTNDDGTLLEELLENITIGISNRSQRTAFDYDLILNNIRIFRKTILYAADSQKSSLSNMPTSLWKRYDHLATVPSSKSSTTKNSEQERRRETARYEIVNKIVDSLHETTKMGSFVVYAALEATCSKLSELRGVRTMDIPTLVPSAVEALISGGVQRVPDQVTALHVPAVVAYLLDIDYPVVCHALHLPHLAEQDPGISSQLAQLAQQLTKLDTSAPDYVSRCLAIEHRATRIMRVSLPRRRSPIPEAEKEHHAVPDYSSNESSHSQGGTTSVETPGMGAASVNIPAPAADVNPHETAVSTSERPSSLPNIAHHGVLNHTLTTSDTGSRGYMEIMLENTHELEGLSELDNTLAYTDSEGIDLEFWNFASADLVQVMDVAAFGQSIGFS